VPDSRSFFELFHFPEQFALDVDVLEQRYRQLQRSVHPDKYAASEELAQRLAVQYSSLLNEARDTLRSPVKRANYLLSRVGRADAGLKDNTTTADAEFLMQQIEWREALAECTDQPDPLAALNVLKSLFEEVMSGYEKQFDAAFGRHDFDAAHANIVKMQFLAKLLAEVDMQEERLLDE
jgi:molecular chaperone HscB